jgi:4-amino-4-deoxy-L-arabinose transferase-like glycosyltransferase
MTVVETRPQTPAPPVARRSRAQSWVLLAVTALAVRLLAAYVLLGDVGIIGDARFYAENARGITSSFPGTGAFFWPPGISYVLAAGYAVLGDALWVTRLVCVVVSVLGVLAVRSLAEEVADDRRVAVVAGWLAALYPPAVLMAGEPFSHPLSLLALVVLCRELLVGMRRRSTPHLLAAGLAFGVGVITRPSTASIALALAGAAVLLWWRGRRGDGGVPVARLLGAAAAIVVGALVVVAPVLAYNADRGVGATISTNNEYNVWIGNNPYTPDYKTSHLAQREGSAFSPEVERYLESFRNRPDRRSAMKDEAVRYVRDHPEVFALRSFNRAQAFWGFDYYMSAVIRRYTDLGPVVWVPALVAEAAGFLVAGLLALVGLTVGRSRLRSGPTALLVAVVLSFQLPYLVSFAVGVYHFAVMGLLLVFSAAGAVTVWEARSSPRSLLRSRALLVAAAVFLVIQVPYAWFVGTLA